MELLLIFVSGLLLSFHCVGMCGGFVALLAVRPVGSLVPVTGLSASLAGSWRSVLPEQVVFNLGRLATYALLGAAAGGLGAAGTASSRTGRLQGGLMLAAGIFIFSSGLALSGLLRHWSLFRNVTAAPRPWLAHCIELVLRLPRAARAVPLGMLWGFLPCGLIYAMLARAASTASTTEGALVMLAFGAGTIPALLLVAFFAGAFSLALREKMVRLSGAFLALIGVWTFYRGIAWLVDPGKLSSAHSLMHPF